MSANTVAQGTVLENSLAKLVSEADQKQAGDKCEAELVNEPWE